jgi:hypothetical protein
MEWQIAKWKREAVYRFRNLQEKDQVRREAIYYNKVVGMSFNQMRQLFISELSQN